MKRAAKKEIRIIERYAVTEEGLPLLEIAHWQRAARESTLGRSIPGMDGKWVLLAVENPIAHTALYEKYGVLNPETGFKELVIPDDAEYWDYYKCPMKPGYVQIFNREEMIQRLKVWNKELSKGNFTAYNASRAAAAMEYQRLVGDQWSPELASRLSGYILKGDPNVSAIAASTPN